MTRKIPTILSLLSLALATGGNAQAGLPASLDGSWYNPLQSGHGLTVERIDHDSALLFWHVFDPAGRPLTLYIQTQIDGDTMRGEVLAPSGMRFGRFDESELALPFWGTLEMSFSDCTHATLKYDSALPDYGKGEIALTRLLPASQDCSLRSPAGLATLAGHHVMGTVHGEFTMPPNSHWFAEPNYRGPLVGFVTEEGGLALHGTDERLPSDEFVLVGTSVTAAPGEAKLQARAYPNGWLYPVLGITGGFFPPDRADRFALELQTRTNRAKGLLLPKAWVEPGQPDAVVEVSPATIGAGRLQPGVYTFVSNALGSAQPRQFQMEVAPDLSLCVRVFPEESQGPLPLPAPSCAYTGHASVGDKHFEFMLSRPGQPTAAGFTGVGQANYCRPAQLLCTSYLRMIGDDGRTGLALYSDRFAP